MRQSVQHLVVYGCVGRHTRGHASTGIAPRRRGMRLFCRTHEKPSHRPYPIESMCGRGQPRPGSLHAWPMFKYLAGLCIGRSGRPTNPQLLQLGAMHTCVEMLPA